MDVVSLCPLRASALVWRPSTGGFALSVVCKGTYEVRAGELRLSQTQEDPNEEDNFWDDDPLKSLRAPCDLVPFKPRADVVLVGQAFAPNMVPLRTLLARLSVGGVDKAVEVHADRTRTAEGGTREGQPFTSMQLRYERAAAGTENPVGVRADGGRPGPMPNLLLPARRTGVAGFGPIAPRWPARRAKLGTHADAFPPRRWEEEPLPEDLDASFFNVAPADQQADRLEPGDRLVLENLSPAHPRLVAELPRSAPRAFVDRGAGIEEVSLVCDTLWIDSDRAVCTLVWRGQIGLHGLTDDGRVSVLIDSPSRPLTWPEIQAHCTVRRRAIDEGETHTDEYLAHRGGPTREYVAPGHEPSRPDAALPFVPSSTAEPSREAPASSARPPWLEANPPPPTGDALSETVMPGVLRADARWSAEPPRPANIAPVTLGQATGPLLSASSLNVAPLGAGQTLGQAASKTAAQTVGQVAAPLVSPSAAPVPVPADPPPSPPVPLPVASAVLTASNLAVAQLASEAKPSSPADAAPAPAKSEVARAAPAEIVDLLWFDAGLPDRVRVAPAWFTLVARARPVPEQPMDDDPPEDPPAVVDRRDVFTVLTDADPTSLDDLEGCVAAATTPKGAFTPPLAALRGELEIAFDDLETLKATLAVVAPFAVGPDKRLKETFEAANEALKERLFPTSGRPVENLTARLRDAFAAGSWSLPAGYLDLQVERALVEQRRYQRRAVLGETWLRALLGLRGSAAPVYLPEALVGRLPLYARFNARVIVEVLLQQDPFEAHPYALKCLALARAVPARPAPRPARPGPTRS
jgi:hypothetical protein